MRHRDRALEAGRDPNIRGRSHYANERQVTGTDEPVLDTVTGEEESAELKGPEHAEDGTDAVDIDARPMSEVTGEPDPGTTDETIDGLDETEEATRRAAEDLPTGAHRRER